MFGREKGLFPKNGNLFVLLQTVLGTREFGRSQPAGRLRPCSICPVCTSKCKNTITKRADKTIWQNFFSAVLYATSKRYAPKPRKAVQIIWALLRRSLDLSRRSLALKIRSLTLKKRTPEDYIRGFYTRILYVFQPFRKCFNPSADIKKPLIIKKERG